MTLPDFKSRARDHQIRYRNQVLNKEDYDTYFTWLTDEDAVNGLNLYTDWPRLVELTSKRYKFHTKKKTVKNMYKDMLRSEHIPFNMFVPLKPEFGQDQSLSFWQKLTPNLDIQKIMAIEIEWVWPVDINQLLDDHTSFDAYLSYENSNGDRCGLGIEVKYTEKSYPYGTTEELRMFDVEQSSPYHQATNNSNLYKSGATAQLRKPKLKQFWRNHLLGEKGHQIGLVKSFTSMHLYPQGNTYQQKACDAYQKQLSDERIDSFVPITYETFIELGRSVFNEDEQRTKWLDYLEKRYIVRS